MLARPLIIYEIDMKNIKTRDTTLSSWTPQWSSGYCEERMISSRDIDALAAILSQALLVVGHGGGIPLKEPSTPSDQQVKVEQSDPSDHGLRGC